jgi:cytochrome c2
MLYLMFAIACTGPKESATESTPADDSNNNGIVGDATNGQTLFNSCAGCHGADGTGGIDIGGTPSSDLTARVPALSDGDLEDRIMNGFNTAMPSQYTDPQDVADVIAYLRVTFP